jgi:hypothetical protein
MTSAIPEGTELKYFYSTVNNALLQNRFSAAITIIANGILQNENSSSQLIKLAKQVVSDSSAMEILVRQAIKFAISEGLIITSASTLSNQDGTFDDNTVADTTIESIILGLAANSSLLTILGYKD